MQTLTTKPQQSVARPKCFATVLAAMCLLLTLLFSATPSYADASNRKQAISQALAQSGGNAEVLGVKEVSNGNGGIVFAVKLISNGRVKVINIPKSE